MANAPHSGNVENETNDSQEDEPKPKTITGCQSKTPCANCARKAKEREQNKKPT